MNDIRKLNATVQRKQQINTTEIMSKLQVRIKVNERIFKTLINSKTTENFMSQQLMNREEFVTRKLKKSQIIQIIDERKLKIRIIEEIVPLFIAIQKHHE